MATKASSTRVGIVERHGEGCRSHDGGRCNCAVRYEAWIHDKRAEIKDADGNVIAHGKKVRKSFAGPGALQAAKDWRDEGKGAVRVGTLKATSSVTLEAAGLVWIEGARDGTVLTRSGDRYKPSAIRGYESSFKQRIVPELGAHKLSAITRVDLQDFADRLNAKGLDPSTVRNTLMPLRAIYKRAMERGEVAVNPTAGLRLPAVRGKRDRIADPKEAATLIAAVPDSDRGAWATAMYAGLRAGELAGLQWGDIEWEKDADGKIVSGIIFVQRSYDTKERAFVKPKSRAGERKVPIAGVLRRHLLEHTARCAWSAQTDGLVFGQSASEAFDYWRFVLRAKSAWKAKGLTAIGLHESRHSFASLMIGAGVNAKALSVYMGHSSITITLDRYGHLMPGNETEAAGLLDAYLERASAAIASGQ
jgi:integrase